ncbi:Wzz/FepE/Etk N-terminal domain-containing protein [Pseudomonas aeruginosa]
MNKQNSSLMTADGEVDLVKLVKELWVNKVLILLTTLLALIGSFTYAYLSKPVYEYRVAVVPPALGSIEGFNVGRRENGLDAYTVRSIYAIFSRNLLSDENKKEFFYKIYLPQVGEGAESEDEQEEFYKKFSKEVKIDPANKPDADRYTVIVEGTKREVLATWAQAFVRLAADRAVHEVIDSAGRDFQVRNAAMQSRITVLQNMAKGRRDDRIARLKEALLIAESLKIDGPPLIEGASEQQPSSIMDGDLMYMRGAKALRAEINNLESRSVDAPFIPELRTLQEKLSWNSSLSVDSDAVAVYKEDEGLSFSNQPIKPKKILIVTIGTLAGLIIGILLAVLAGFIRKLRSDGSLR